MNAYKRNSDKMNWRNDKIFDTSYGWDMWLTEEDVKQTKLKWEDKAIVTVDRFNCGTIKRIHISNPHFKSKPYIKR
jgi:hypothetical protein